MLVVIFCHLVAHYSRITITEFVITLNEFLFVFLVVVFGELLCTEDVIPLMTGIGLFHRTIGTEISHIPFLEREQLGSYRIPMRQTLNLELMHAHFLMLIDYDS